MTRRKGKGIPGHVFAVPLMDGSARIAQVVGIDWEAFEEPIFAFTLIRAEDWSDGTPLSMDDVIAVQTVTSDVLRMRQPERWRMIGSAPLLAVPNEVLSASERRFLRSPEGRNLLPPSNPIVIGSANLNIFLEACLGLRPWDDFAWPEFLDGILLPGRARPTAAYMGDRHRSPEG